ncbi:MAG: DPP IV N-terminal domain-containing protein [Chloroflexota bacterium]
MRLYSVIAFISLYLLTACQSNIDATGEIVFQTTRENGRDTLATMNPNGSDVTILDVEELSRPRYHPAWSPDGTQIAFDTPFGPRNTKIVILNLATGEETQLEGVEGNNEMPAWSPDGTQIAFIAGNSLYITDLGGGEPERLTSARGNPAWSPDGTQIAYTDRNGQDLQIFVINVDGNSDAQQLTDAQNAGQPAWSPDGSQIAFARFDRLGQQRDIAIINSDGTGFQWLITNDADDYHPTWSPDGAYIAFSSDRSGNLDIFIARNDGTNVRNITRNSATDRAPHWSSASN